MGISRILRAARCRRRRRTTANSAVALVHGSLLGAACTLRRGGGFAPSLSRFPVARTCDRAHVRTDRAPLPLWSLRVVLAARGALCASTQPRARAYTSTRWRATREAPCAASSWRWSAASCARRFTSRPLSSTCGGGGGHGTPAAAPQRARTARMRASRYIRLTAAKRPSAATRRLATVRRPLPPHDAHRGAAWAPRRSSAHSHRPWRDCPAHTLHARTPHGDTPPQTSGRRPW